MVGILGYGCTFAAVAPTAHSRCAGDEDFVTLAVEAARRALTRSDMPQAVKHIGAVYVGTQGRMPDDQPAAAIVGEALGVNPRCHCADLHSGAKSGAEAFFAVENLVKPSTIELGLAIATDVLDPDAPATAASASAFLLGRLEGDMLATIDIESGRRALRPDDSHRAHHGDVPLAEDDVAHSPAFEAVMTVAREMLARKRLRASDFAHAVFQQPGDVFPPQVALALGFTDAQLSAGWLAPPLDPAQAAFAPTGLAALLDVIEPGQRILMCAYGANVGADAYVLTGAPRCAKRPATAHTIGAQLTQLKAGGRHA